MMPVVDRPRRMLPEPLLVRLSQLLLDNVPFSVIINGNEGKIQSYDVKEHYKVR